MIKSHKHIIHVESKNPPVVELDSAAHSAYVRFSREKVCKTVVIDVNRRLVTVDLNRTGAVIGVELAGIGEFSVDSLIKKAGISGVTQSMLRRARYIPANAESALCGA